MAVSTDSKNQETHTPSVEQGLTDSSAQKTPSVDPKTSSQTPSKWSVYFSGQPSSLGEDWKTVLVLMALLGALYLPGIGQYGLYDPWETHYGEVARNMVESSNYIDPLWGAAWDPTYCEKGESCTQPSSVKRERHMFYSKPPLIMWMMAAGMNLFGFNEVGVRFFFPFVMLLALLAIYLAVSRFFNRRVAFLATAVSATAPFMAFMSRQAVTDGPMVALMTIGMMCLGLALFGIDKDERASRLVRGVAVFALVAVMIGQLWTMLPMDRSPDVIRPYGGSKGWFFSLQWWLTEVFTVGSGKGWAVALSLVPIACWAAWRVARQTSRQLVYLYLFYICCGLVVPAKGWLGWAPMGLSIVGYLVISGEWKRLAQVDIPTGLLIVAVTGHFWVVAMLAGHHPGWWDRFIIHDHYRRLFAGVHSIDSGGFEYFFRWIGYGMFPWIGLLPLAVLRSFSGLRTRVSEFTPRQRFEVLMLLWAFGGFFLFSKSSTKFHHYILPIIPPLSILVALYVDDIITRRARLLVLMLPCAAAMTVWVGQDMYRMPSNYTEGSQNWVNLFTYKYDREWARYTPPEKMKLLKSKDKNSSKFVQAQRENKWLIDLAQPVKMITLVAVLGLLLMVINRDWLKEAGTLFVFYAAGWCALWCLHDYLPTVAQDWSQKGMWDAYYADCTRFKGSSDAFRTHIFDTTQRIPKKIDQFPRGRCMEPIMAFRTNWRGEVFYSANTVLPALETKHIKPFLKQWGNTKPFYLFTERNRIRPELEPNLPKHLKGRYREVFGSHLKFVLLRIDSKLPPKSKSSPKGS